MSAGLRVTEKERPALITIRVCIYFQPNRFLIKTTVAQVFTSPLKAPQDSTKSRTNKLTNRHLAQHVIPWKSWTRTLDTLNILDTLDTLDNMDTLDTLDT